ncbi:MAG TPA: hypothetical protein VGQ39_02830 [Pyrinomonadaceae bacterium]|jgi:hypothetical protein|nr:hypothetical protein [Pyrinomonadaceae bacterium]
MEVKDSFVDERLQALERLLQSETFSNADSMRHFLEFIVGKSVAGCVDEIKEYTIATEVLGRSHDFDPKSDNIVRVQAHRLRKKLDEYYSQEGAHDPVRILIPSGHYYPEYNTISSPQKTPDIEEMSRDLDLVQTSPVSKMETASAGFSTRLPWQWVALGLLILNLVLISYLLLRSVRKERATKNQIPLAESLTPLWQPFITTDQPPLIVYSNALFLMSEEGDLYRYYNDTSHSFAMGAEVPSVVGLERRGPIPNVVGPLYYFDSYTGTGEVIAMGRIAELLSQSGQNFLVKRSRIASYEDVRNRNVIFLGTSLEDSILGKLPVESDLVFEEPTGRQFVGRLLIRDRHPFTGMPSTYQFRRDERTKALQAEFALISLLPGVTPNQYVLVLAGLSTIGTQAAAEFATSDKNMLALDQMRATGSSNAARSAYFQALLEIQIRDGIAVKTNCLLVRELHRNQP